MNHVNKKIIDAIMIYHGTYFKRGVKRTFEELAKLSFDKEFLNNMKKISASEDISELRNLLKSLLLYAESHVQQENQKENPSEKLSGTYEEMYSNWRNKVEEAAVNNDVYSSFMNMCSLQNMFSEILSEVNIGCYNIMGEYHPDCLQDNIKIYDKYLQKYEEIYKQVGIAVKRFANVDAFVADYLHAEYVE